MKISWTLCPKADGLTNTSLAWAPKGKWRPRRPHETWRSAVLKRLKQYNILSWHEASAAATFHENRRGSKNAMVKSLCTRPPTVIETSKQE